MTKTSSGCAHLFLLAGLLAASPDPAMAQVQETEWRSHAAFPVDVIGSVNVPPILMGTADFRFIMNPAIRFESNFFRAITPWAELSLVHLSGDRCVDRQANCGVPITSAGIQYGASLRIPVAERGSESEHPPLTVFAGAGLGYSLHGGEDFPSRRYMMGADFLPRPRMGLRLELAIVSASFTAFVPSLGFRYSVR